MISKVMLDLDDVCNLFTMDALHYAGATDTILPYREYPERARFDIVKAANLLRDPAEKEYTAVEFWGLLDERFWASIRMAPYLYSLLDSLASLIGEKNICVASSTTLYPGCLSGKLIWIQNFMPSWLHRQYLLGPCKHLLAQSGTLLIDDNRDNCEKFRRHGGEAILITKPWNMLGPYKPEFTVNSIDQGFRKYFDEGFKC